MSWAGPPGKDRVKTKGGPVGRGMKQDWAFLGVIGVHSLGRLIRPALAVIREALAEIRGAAVVDPAGAGDGAVLFLERIPTALSEVDRFSNTLGRTLEDAFWDLSGLMGNAEVEEVRRDEWLERLWTALCRDETGFLREFSEYWGYTCGSVEKASEWADRFLPSLLFSWLQKLSRPFPGDIACFSSLHAAERYREILELLPRAPYLKWDYLRFGVRALASMGRVDEAVKFAHRETADSVSLGEVSALCEAVLFDAGRIEEAFEKFSFHAADGWSPRAKFRAVAKKYPHKSSGEILELMSTLDQEDPARWFPVAVEQRVYEAALRICRDHFCGTGVLVEKGRAFVEENPEFSMEVGLTAIRNIAEDAGGDTGESDAREAFDLVKEAARRMGREKEARNHLDRILRRNAPNTRALREVLGWRWGKGFSAWEG